MAFVTPLERRVLVDVYNMTDANIAALDPGIAERLISDQRGGLVYDIIRDDPDKPEIATAIGELRAMDFVDAGAESGKWLGRNLWDGTKFVASLPGRALGALGAPLGEAGKALGKTLGIAAVGFLAYLYLTRK